MLLTLHAGARGLNLTEATHVFLIEPQMDAAVEAQAVARVHRIGQLNETHVHRFVVRDSIEQVVYDMRLTAQSHHSTHENGKQLYMFA